MPVQNPNLTADLELIEGCRKQNRRAQRQLYERYASRMFAVCMRYAKDKDRAQDILQDGFITVFNKIDSYRNEGSFEGWMRRIFVNTALMSIRGADILKDTADITELKSGLPVEDDHILDKIDGHLIINLISQMPEGFRMIFNLSVIDGFSHVEIAQKLGISEGTSRSQLLRARAWLQAKIVTLKMREQ